MLKKLTLQHIFMCLIFVYLMASATFAQTTPFSYQGKLTNAGNPANATYDMQFSLFDAVMGGAQIGSTLPQTAVQVTNGIFTVQLDFGVSAFSGADRFLEIGVGPAGGGTFTTLAPRQQIGWTPYAIRTLSATAADALSSACVGCVQDAQINSVAGSKVNGTIPVASVPAGSDNYIQNTMTPQTGASFNISGNGTTGGTLSGNVVNAATLYNIGGARVLSIPGTRNLFTGVGAGQAHVNGHDNAFFGRDAGLNNTGNAISGSFNSFFGSNAGKSNLSGGFNSFFGSNAGMSNIGNANVSLGSFNSFFGTDAGLNNTGNDNAFFGTQAGNGNTMGERNSFFGRNAGSGNASGSDNTVIGANATAGVSGSSNTIIGANAGVGAGNLTNATAIGAGTVVTNSNSIVLGNNANVGIGTANPSLLNGGSGRLVSVSAGTNPGMALTNTGAGGNQFFLYSNNTGLAGGGSFRIFDATNAADRFMIDNSGNVNIGSTLAFNSKLNVISANTNNALFVLGGNTSSTTAGDGVSSHGGNSSSGLGGTGTVGLGGTSTSGTAGTGASNFGGNSTTGDGGLGVWGVGGNSGGVLRSGGAGVQGLGGDGSISTSSGGTGVVAMGGTSNGDSTGPAALLARGGNSANGRGGVGIFVNPGNGPMGTSSAGIFNGNVTVNGSVSKFGGSFKIDHPLDPANKYLAHSFVESPDMMNIYNGNVMTNAEGYATISLPDYFAALNKDFRYQLTVIGQFAQAIVSQEIKDNQFTIQTDKPSVKVSWQVTGVRQDAWANAHRITIEEDKPEQERGSYLSPELFGQPEQTNVEWARHPELMRQITEGRRKVQPKGNDQ